MPDFGYYINPDKQIDYDKNDKGIAEYLNTREPSFRICISCGTCTATCTTGHFDEFNFRKLILLIKRGEVKNIEDQFIKCMLCGKCQVACPRGVSTRNLLYQLKNYFENEAFNKPLK